MSILSKEQIRDLIATSNITTVNDITTTLKDMFKDVLQEMLEAELDDHLGYGKYNTSEISKEKLEKIVIDTIETKIMANIDDLTDRVYNLPSI